MPDLIHLVATHLADPRNKSRKRPACDARTIFSAVARKIGLSYQEIADMLGKHRTTVYAYERLCEPKNLGKNYEIYLKLLNEIRNTDSPDREAKDGEVRLMDEAPLRDPLLAVQGRPQPHVQSGRVQAGQ